MAWGIWVASKKVSSAQEGPVSEEADILLGPTSNILLWKKTLLPLAALLLGS